MNALKVLSNLVEQSGRNEQLLSSQERELLKNILRHVQESGGDPDVAARIQAVLSRAVGETVVQRASDGIGRSVLEEISPGLSLQSRPEPEAGTRIFLNSPPPPSTGPRPPSPGPRPPGAIRSGHPISWGRNHRPQRLHPHPRPVRDRRRHLPVRDPAEAGYTFRHKPSTRPVALQDEPELLRADCVILDEFLAPEELQELMRYTLAHENDFQLSEVISPGLTGSIIDAEYRRSRVLMDLGRRGCHSGPYLLGAAPGSRKTGMEPFPSRGWSRRSRRAITEISSGITATTLRKKSQPGNSPMCTSSTGNRRRLRAESCACITLTGRTAAGYARERIRRSYRNRTRLFSSRARCCTRSRPSFARRRHSPTAVSR